MTVRRQFANPLHQGQCDIQMDAWITVEQVSYVSCKTEVLIKAFNLIPSMAGGWALTGGEKDLHSGIV